jgi:tetratricopeptide (TPR) repeat protein/sugar lactone lactonase YvrE
MTPKSAMKSIVPAVFLFLASFSLFSQEYNFAYNTPEKTITGTKYIAQAINSSGVVHYIDATSKSVSAFGESGKLMDAFNTIQTESGTITLLNPTQLTFDQEDNLFIYDDEIGKIIRKPLKGNATTFGEKGSGLGQIDDVLGLAIDSKGYCYVLNGNRKQVDIFDAQGRYVSWINGTSAPFDDPIAIGINGADEIYVLERGGPHVFMFDPSGNLVNTNRSLASRKNIVLTKPIGMAVLSNGDFFILDAASCQSTHFNRIGVLLGTIGSKGTSSKAVFQQASLISTSSIKSNYLCILDAPIQQSHLFKLASLTPSLKPSAKRLRMNESKTTRLPMWDMVIAPSGNRYVIQADNRQKVVAYLDTTNKDVFSIIGKIEEAAGLAADSASNLYVVDRGNDEVLMFDPKGTLIRKFGKESENKLKDPVSIVIQKSGNIVVADKSRGSLLMWNSQGVFKKVITSADNSVIKSPAKLQCDSKDQLYVWDDDANCIYRTGSGGWPTAEKKITARPLKPGDKPGVISGFTIDPLDNIILYNATTHQIEIYAWDFEPLLKFSLGRPGKGANSHENIEQLLLDKGTLKLYLTEENGLSQDVYQFYLAPPTPQAQVTFDVVDDKLQIYYAKEKSPAILAYGLLTQVNEKDTVLFKSTTSNITITPTHNDLELHRYGFVGLSWSDYSDPAMWFDDYFTYAGQMAAANRHEEALGAWQLSLEKMGHPLRMTQYIAYKVSLLSLKLIQRNEIGLAMSYSQYAYSLTPNNADVQKNYASVLKAYYLFQINNGEMQSVLKSISSLQSNSTMKNLVLQTADSVGLILSLEENLSSINNAIALQKKLMEWDPTNYTFISSHASTFLRMYKFQSYRNVSWPELKTMLSEVSRYGQQGYLGLKQGKKPYYEIHLEWIEALNALGNYAEAQKQATLELGTTSSSMTPAFVVRYRNQLAVAMSGLSNYVGAETEYTTILSSQPNNEEVNMKLAEAYIQQKKYDAAKSIYQKLILGKLDHAHLTARVGYVELLKGNYPEAIFQLEKSIKEAPAMRENYGYLAEAYHQSSNNPKALDNYEVAIEYLNDILNGSGRHNQSEISLKELKKRREDYLFVSASIHDELKDYSAAIENYKSITNLNPENGAAWFGLGNTLTQLGLIYEALDAYNHAMAVDENNPKYSNAYVNSIKSRDQALTNEPALNIVLVEVPDVYPSLYKNYADVYRLPVGEIVMANNTSNDITPTSIQVNVNGLMSQPTQVVSPAIDSYSNEHIKLAAVFPESILENSEKQNLILEVTITYLKNGKPTTIQKSTPFVLYGRNAITWSDKRRLSAFTMPNAHDLIEYNKKADVIFRDAPTFQMNKSIVKALQIYTLLNASGIAYSADPAQSYSRVSVHTDVLDYLQYPTETIKRKGGDCDDLVALCAALLENGGIAAAYIDIPGHVMLAFDCGIKPQEVAANGMSSREVIITGDRVWIPIETTVIGKKNFLSAWKNGAERFYSELDAGNFPELIPLAEAWTVFAPSTYTPPGFVAEPPSDNSVLSEYHEMISQLFAKSKREAITSMQIRYESEQNNSYVKNAYATLLAQTGKFDEARPIFEEVLSLSPDNPTTLNNLGNICFLHEQYNEAIQYYESASAADPKDANILINLCKANLSAGNKQSAKIWFEKAIALNSELEYLYDDLKPKLK